MFALLRSLFGMGGKALDRLLPDRAKLQEKQLEINAETERASNGRLTPRKLLMYLLAVCFAWEVMLRPVVATYWPGTLLPPSMLQEIMLAVSATFGLGF